MTIECPISCPYEFRLWRKSVHNALADRRRRCSWWRGVGIWGWYTGADIRGLVALDMLTVTDFALTFRRHGEINLRPIRDEDVRVEVYRAVQAISTALADQTSGRYQSLKVAIAPRTTRKRFVLTPTIPAQVIEPLPMILF